MSFFSIPKFIGDEKKNSLGIEKKPGHKTLLGMKKKPLGMKKKLMPFLIVMTAMFYDIQQETINHWELDRKAHPEYEL